MISIQLIVINQDFRTRSIHWLVIPLLASICLAGRIFLMNSPWSEIIWNWCILLLQGIALLLFFSWKAKTWINPLDTLIGWGDVLYLGCLAILFPTFIFVLFMISGLLFSLLSYTLYRWIKRNASAEIPLAGLLSVWVLVLMICLWAIGPDVSGINNLWRTEWP